MSQQLTISSLFSALALVTLALFARSGDLAVANDNGASIVKIEASVAAEV